MIPIKQRRLSLHNYSLVFEDQFNYQNNSDLDANWIRLPNLPNSVSPGSSNTLNNSSDELAKSTPPQFWDKEGMTFNNGLIELNGRKLTDPEINSTYFGKKSHLSSGIVKNSILPFGVFDIRAKAPEEWDTWPALWTYSSHIEFDLMDTNSNPARSLVSVIHDNQIRPGQHPEATWGYWEKLTSPSKLEIKQGNNNVWATWKSEYKKDDVVTYTNDDGILGYYKCRRPALAAQSIAMNTFKLKGTPFSDDFHNYTLVWTPLYFSLFLDYKELFSWTTDYFYGRTRGQRVNPNGPNPVSNPRGYQIVNTINELFLDLQYSYGRGFESQEGKTPRSSLAQLDIDYVKIYKPNQLVANGPSGIFLSTFNTVSGFDVNKTQTYLDDVSQAYSNTYDNSTIFDLEPPESEKDNFSTGKNLFYEVGPLFEKSHQTIKNDFYVSTLKKDGGKFYFVGKDNRMYNYYKLSDGNYGFGPLMQNIYNVKNHVVEDSGIIFYLGTDNKVYRFWWENDAWHNEKLTDDQIDIEGTLHPRVNGKKVYFLGTDKIVYNYYLSNSIWRLVPLTYDKINIVYNSDIQVTENGDRIFYLATTNQIYNYFYDNGWVHKALPNPPVNIAGEMVIRPAGGKVYFKGEDNKLYNYYWKVDLGLPDGGLWICDVLNQIADVKKDVRLVAAIGTLFYCNLDDKICSLKWDNGWQHSFLDVEVDDYSGEMECTSDGRFIYYRTNTKTTTNLGTVSLFFKEESSGYWKNVDLLYTDGKPYRQDFLVFDGLETIVNDYGYLLNVIKSIFVSDDGFVFFIDNQGRLFRTYLVSNTNPQKRDESTPTKFIFLPR